MPVRHAFVIEMVNSREDLGNAIALNSAMLSTARLVGPALGGILLATVGAGYCFLYDSFSYVAAIAALFAMQIMPKPIEPQTSSTWQRLQEGFSYIYNFAPIRSILLLLAMQGVFGIAYLTLLPIFAVDILHGGPETMGFLSAAGAVGAVLACVYLSLRRSVLGLERIIALCPVVIGLGLVAFSQSRLFPLSIALLVLVGIGSTLQIACSNTVIQTIVEDSKRGRVMSFYALSLVGMMPLSNLLAGTLGHYIGAQNTLIFCGMVCILGATWFVGQLPLVTQWIQWEMFSTERYSVDKRR